MWRLRRRAVAEAFAEFLAKRVERRKVLKELRDALFRESTEIFDYERFIARLREDILKARYYVLVISPYLKKSVIKKFLSYREVRDSRDRVSLMVLTKAIDDFKQESNRKSHEDCVNLLSESGIGVFQMKKLHFKAVIIDDEILYLGSINVLSVMPIDYLPADYMVRFKSEALVDEVIERVVGRETFEGMLKQMTTRE